MQETFKVLIETAGGIVTESAGAERDWGVRRGGDVKHEVGSTRMGSDPRRSVLNQHCQAWDVKNLFVTDAAPFVSNADKNPMLTITALGWRTSDYIVDQARKLSLKPRERIVGAGAIDTNMILSAYWARNATSGSSVAAR